MMTKQQLDALASWIGATANHRAAVFAQHPRDACRELSRLEREAGAEFRRQMGEPHP